jgi:hypothetical protein
LSDFCGLPAEELVAFRVERLIIHELLVHVTTGIAVPDGRDDEDLGKNFRGIAATILNRFISPHRGQLARVFEELKSKSSAIVERELSQALARTKTATKPPADQRWPFSSTKLQKPSQPPESAAERDLRIASEWLKKAQTSDDRLEAACFAALPGSQLRSSAAMAGYWETKRCSKGWRLRWYVTISAAKLLVRRSCRSFRRPLHLKASDFLPRQDKPVVMNVKGASASGKSSMRPLQKHLAGKLNLPWQEFALISPDIWRKFLLDYATLGAAYKYAGTLTGHEIEIIDKKLDHRMAARAARGEMPHLLIDRFRFDSFVPNLEEGSSRLLTRFGDLVYMFFMITPPETTVERAWTRGLKVGRYKAVEDLLAHNVEAYAGMPELFFTWALITGKRVHYEFLDNSVAEGRPPRTVAFGWNEEMTILDIKSMLDIERFRRIDIQAQQAADVYASTNLSPQNNVDFLKRCARWIPVINFADYETGYVYARLKRGKWAWRDDLHFEKALENPDAKAGLLAIAPNIYSPGQDTEQAQIDVAIEKTHTLGAWGTRNL